VRAARNGLLTACGQAFPTKQFVREGFVTANTCGKTIVSTRPGELVILVRPLSWWEKRKQ
jgi:hypothetical protein